MGAAALSVESATTRFTPASMAASMTFCAPRTLVLIGLERVVLADRDVLERGRVDDDVDAFHRAPQTLRVADVADEEPQLRIAVRRIELRHLVLLEFVARIDDDASNVRIALEDGPDECLAERTGAAGDENRGLVEHAYSRFVDAPPRSRFTQDT